MKTPFHKLCAVVVNIMPWLFGRDPSAQELPKAEFKMHKKPSIDPILESLPKGSYGPREHLGGNRATRRRRLMGFWYISCGKGGWR